MYIYIVFDNPILIFKIFLLVFICSNVREVEGERKRLSDRSSRSLFPQLLVTAKTDTCRSQDYNTPIMTPTCVARGQKHEPSSAAFQDALARSQRKESEVLGTCTSSLMKNSHPTES